ncbi:unnamed protein product, partial [Mesorhabditis spiculigera]
MYGFVDGKAIVDPNAREELFLDGCLWMAINKRKEVCAMHQTGRLILSTGTITACVKRSFQRASDLTDLIASTCSKDAITRGKNQKTAGFSNLIGGDFISLYENQPNEMIQIEDRCDSPSTSDGQGRITEASLAEGTTLVEDEEDGDALIQAQVDNIAASVEGCRMEVTKSTKAGRTKAARRNKDQAGLGDLLDGIVDPPMDVDVKPEPLAAIAQSSTEQPQQEAATSGWSGMSAIRRKKL